MKRLLHEQSLSFTGVTEDTVSRVGKILSAEFLVLGSVSKEHEKYIVKMKVINTEKGIIVATHAVDFKINEFERHTIVKKVVVPRKDSIGVYLGYRTMPIKSIAADPDIMYRSRTYPDTKEFYNAQALTGSLTFGGIGNRFYVSKSLMGDVYIGFADEDITWEHRIPLDSQQFWMRRGEKEPGSMDGDIEAFNLSITLNKAFPLSSWFDVFLGTGLEYVVVNNFNFNDAALSPAVRVGFEIRIFRKMGLSVFYSYFNFSNKVKTDGRPDAAIPIYEYGNTALLTAFTFYF